MNKDVGCYGRKADDYVKDKIQLKPDGNDSSLIQLEGGLAVDHHHDAQFFLAGGAKRSGVCGCSFEAHKVVCEPVDHTLDQSAFTGFEVAEKQVAAFALDV